MTFSLRHIVLAASIALMPAVSAAQDISGLWRTEATAEGYLEIEFAPCGPALCGTVARARNNDGVSGPHDTIGRRLVWDMMPTGEAGSWSGGRIWDPRNDRTYNARMQLSGNTLKVEGCVLGFCDGQTWRLVQ